MTGITITLLVASRPPHGCAACPIAGLSPPTMGLAPDMSVTNAIVVLKCGNCGSKRVLTYPESARDARKGARTMSNEAVTRYLVQLSDEELRALGCSMKLLSFNSGFGAYRDFA